MSQPPVSTFVGSVSLACRATHASLLRPSSGCLWQGRCSTSHSFCVTPCHPHWEAPRIASHSSRCQASLTVNTRPPSNVPLSPSIAPWAAVASYRSVTVQASRLSPVQPEKYERDQPTGDIEHAVRHGTGAILRIRLMIL